MSLESDIRNITANSGAEMGVSALHLESGQRIDVDAERVYPLCSVLKIPVLVEAFRQIEEGLFTLDDRWQLTTAEKNLPSGILVFFDDGLAPTVKDLLTLMIIISDNTATDMVMHRLGKDSVTGAMHDLGLADIHVPLTIREIFDDLLPSSDPTQDMLALATAAAQSRRTLLQPRPRQRRRHTGRSHRAAGAHLAGRDHQPRRL